MQYDSFSRQFSALSISEDILKVLEELSFSKMTEIQAKAIPELLAGKDVVGQSETGSGKTAAFSIPILEKITLEPRVLQALILCPTRELCTQVARQIRVLGRKHQGLHVLVLTGGQKIFPQIFSLEKGVHIAVATPGRMVDLLSRSSIDLGQINTLVLDEADRMLDMGFEEDMKTIVSALPKVRQTALFSATFPKKLGMLVKQSLNQPVFISVNAEGPKTPEIDQSFYATDEADKLTTLFSLLNEKQPDSALVFCNLKSTVKEITEVLWKNRISAACLHGDLDQIDRDREMAKFKNKSTRVLVATDVAARGIDVDSLDLVINYDLPKHPETYIHRVGRTARAGKNGRAISLVIPNEKCRLAGIANLTGVPYVIKTINKASIFRRVAMPSKMKTICIFGGRKSKIRPSDILGALTGAAGQLQGDQIGKIEISDTFAYVAVQNSVADRALDGLRVGKIKGRKFRADFVR